MKALLIFLIMPLSALAVERAQVRQWLLDNDHIATITDDSWDDAIKLRSNGAEPVVATWPTAQLGEQPTEWPNAIAAQNALVAAEATQPATLTKRLRIVGADVEIQPDGDHGLILTDPLGNAYLVTVTTNGTLFSTQISASPEVDFATRQARLAAERTALASIAAELNLTPTQVQNVKDYFDADINTLFANLNANQRKFLLVQRDLLKALVKERIKEVR